MTTNKPHDCPRTRALQAILEWIDPGDLYEKTKESWQVTPAITKLGIIHWIAQLGLSQDHFDPT